MLQSVDSTLWALGLGSRIWAPGSKLQGQDSGPWALRPGLTELLCEWADVEDADLLDLALAVLVQQLDEVLPDEAVPSGHNHHVHRSRCITVTASQSHSHSVTVTQSHHSHSIIVTTSQSQRHSHRVAVTESSSQQHRGEHKMDNRRKHANVFFCVLPPPPGYSSSCQSNADFLASRV